MRHHSKNDYMKQVAYLFMGFIAGISTVCAAKDGTAATLQTPQKNSLTRDTIHLDEVIVTGSRVPISRDMMPIPVSVVGRQSLEQSGETTLLPTLMQQVPGLFVTSRGMSGYGVSAGSAGAISLRGFAGSAGRVLILIDGHPQYASIFGHPIADAYIASDAERVEVSRGPASVLYGSNAMGGAINIITRQTTGEGNHLRARLSGGSYGTQRYMLNNSYRTGRFGGVIGGNYERSDGHRKNSFYESLSGFAKAGYTLNDEWQLTANVNLVRFKADNPGTISRPMLDGTVDIVRGMSGLSLENQYAKTQGAVNFYYNWGNHTINDGYFEGGTPQPYLFHSTDYMGGVNLYQAVHPFEGNTVTGGFDVKLYGGNAYRNPQTEIYADHKKLYELAGYVFVQQQIRRLMLHAGLRLEHHKLYGNEWVPQAGVSFRAAPQTHLKLSVSKGFRSPNIRELYMYVPANEKLLPERSLSYDFTVSQRLLENRLSMEMSLFWTKGDNIVKVGRVEGRPQNQNAGEFIHKGLEFGFHWHILHNLRLNGNYSYLHMDKPITGAPHNKLYTALTYAPGRFTFNAGVQTIEKLYLSTGEKAQTSDYTLVDARAAYRPLKWAEVFVKGDNLLSRSYETMLGFPMPGVTWMAGIILDL